MSKERAIPQKSSRQFPPSTDGVSERIHIDSIKNHLENIHELKILRHFLASSHDFPQMDHGDYPNVVDSRFTPPKSPTPRLNSAPGGRPWLVDLGMNGRNCWCHAKGITSLTSFWLARKCKKKCPKPKNHARKTCSQSYNPSHYWGLQPHDPMTGLAGGCTVHHYERTKTSVALMLYSILLWLISPTECAHSNVSW